MEDPRWHAKRNERFEMDEGRCVDCGQRAGLQAHHLAYPRSGNPWDVDMEDLRTLCGRCHPLRTQALKEMDARIGRRALQEAAGMSLLLKKPVRCVLAGVDVLVGAVEGEEGYRFQTTAISGDHGNGQLRLTVLAPGFEPVVHGLEPGTSTTFCGHNPYQGAPSRWGQHDQVTCGSCRNTSKFKGWAGAWAAVAVL